MKIIVTGAKGQLGKSLNDAFAQTNEKYDIVYIDIEDVDLTDFEAVKGFFCSHPCDIVINCAAYTAVDRAERDSDLARAINYKAVENLARVAKMNNFKIIHISTDYVFDGKSNIPYKETDVPNPMTVYGTTKLEGEKILEQIDKTAIIIRTSWLYSHYGKNFFLTMKAKAMEGKKVNVVNDQKGTPTFAGDLANAIVCIIENGNWNPGIYHYSNEGECTWYDFTKEIYSNLKADTELVSPITSADFKCDARRPEYSVLSKEKIKNTYKLQIPLWQESLRETIKNI